MQLKGEIVGGIERGSKGDWHIWAGPLIETRLNDKTAVYLRPMKANFSSQIVDYQLLYLISNVSNTHRVYIATIAERLSSSVYECVFTLALYWFKDRMTFFGDWIVFPDGWSSLSGYYKTMAEVLRWLHVNVYESLDKAYRPTSYPQLARCLDILADNMPREVDLPLDRGYALIVDPLPVLAIVKVVCIAAFVLSVALYCYIHLNRSSNQYIDTSLYILSAINLVCDFFTIMTFRPLYYYYFYMVPKIIKI